MNPVQTIATLIVIGVVMVFWFVGACVEGLGALRNSFRRGHATENPNVQERI